MNNVVKIKLESILNNFFIDINDWINNGCKQSTIFHTYSGICGLLLLYTRYVLYSENKDDINFKEHNNYFDSIEILLYKRIGIKDIPFNKSYVDYRNECDTNTIFKNTKRLDFIKQQVEKINAKL